MTNLSLFKHLAGQLMLGSRGELGHVSDQHAFQLDGELTHALAGYTVQFLKEYANNIDDHRFRVGLIYHSTQTHPWGSETLSFTDEVVRMIYPVSAIGSSELTAFQKKQREHSIYYGTDLLLAYALKDTPGVPIFLPILFDRNTTLGQYDQTSATVVLAEPPDTPVIEMLNLIGPAMTARKNLDAFVALKEQLERTLVKRDVRRSVEMKIMDGARAAPAPDTAGAKPDVPADAPAPALTGSTTVNGSALGGETGSRQWYNPALHDATCERLWRFLTQPREYASVEQIRQLIRFRDFTMSQQSELAGTCPIYHAPMNMRLLERGSTDQWNLYLLQGQVELAAADGEKKIVVGGTDNARNALAALKPRKFSVAALTPVRFLWIHENIIAEIQQREPGSKFELV